MIPGLPTSGGVPRKPAVPASGDVLEPAEVYDAPDPLWFTLEKEVDRLTHQVDELRRSLRTLEGRVAALEAGDLPE